MTKLREPEREVWWLLGIVIVLFVLLFVSHLAWYKIGFENGIKQRNERSLFEYEEPSTP